MAVGAAVRADGAGREFGDQAELAAGRLTMLAASAASAASVAEDEAAGSSSVWTQVDEAVNPSYQNEVKARHAARKQLAAGAEGVVKAVAAMSKKPKFETVDPQGGWAPGRAEKARESRPRASEATGNAAATQRRQMPGRSFSSVSGPARTVRARVRRGVVQGTGRRGTTVYGTPSGRRWAQAQGASPRLGGGASRI